MSASAADAEITPRKHWSRQLEHPPPADRASFARAGAAGESDLLIFVMEPLGLYSILTVAEAPMARARAAAMTADLMID
jgi:hypothetical protein